MARKEPVIGTKGPVKAGGTGGGMSKASVAEAMKAKPAPKSTGKAADMLPKATDAERNNKAMRDMK